MAVGAWQDVFHFIRPSRLFVDLYYSAPPFAYTLQAAEPSFARVKLHALLDCPRLPSLHLLYEWIFQLQHQAAASGDARLTPAQLQTAKELADLAGQKVYLASSYDRSELPSQPFLLPDRAGVLQPAPHLLVDDAPWLDGRVDKSASGHLPVVNAAIGVAAAQRLGAQMLSAAVQERPDGALPRCDSSRFDALIAPGAREAIEGQLATWNRNLRSRGFRIAVRRAAAYGRRSVQQSVSSRMYLGSSAPALGRQSSGQAEGATQLKIDQLRHAAIVPVEHIRSRFVVEREGGAELDVTLRPARPGERDGAIGSDSLTVLDSVSGHPTVYLRLSDGASPGATTAPTSSHRALQKHVKRWKPSLATELDRYLGEGAVRDRMLLVELLDVEDLAEMAEVMNLYRIPMPAFEGWIGSRCETAEALRPLLTPASADASELRPLLGSRVIFAGALLPSDLCDEGDADDGVLLYGRLDRIAMHGASIEEVQGRQVAMAKSLREGATVEAAARSTPGFDLVRVGNFSEVVGGVSDIAFFHNRATLHEIYDEARFGRQRLVKECCGALRDVCDRVFNYDAAKVTLFYEPGAGSRFIRQKLLFNIAPVEARKREKRLDDARTDSFVYAYFYGLCVHKLAHFFDVVHGTRHDFYMTEYRANHDLQWMTLLLDRGFEPAKVEDEHRALLWTVVD